MSRKTPIQITHSNQTREDLLESAEIKLRCKGDIWVATIRVGDQQRAGHGGTAPVALIDAAMDLRAWLRGGE